MPAVNFGLLTARCARQLKAAAGRCGEDTSPAPGSGDNSEMRSDRAPPGLPSAGTGTRMPAPTDLPGPSSKPPDLSDFSPGSSSVLVSPPPPALAGSGAASTWEGDPPRAPRGQAGPGTPRTMHRGASPGPPPAAASLPSLSQQQQQLKGDAFGRINGRRLLCSCFLDECAASFH